MATLVQGLKAPSRDWLAFAGLIVLGTIIDTLVRLAPADLPVWMPWEFSWPVFLVTTLTLAWYWRGLGLVRGDDRPSWWRIASFVLGVLSMYAVLQTRIDYYAQHMFFVHRWAHFVLHHAGAFLVAMGMSGQVLFAGMPQFLKPLIKSGPVQAVLNFVQHPVIAPFLFVGLLYFCLIPAIHT